MPIHTPGTTSEWMTEVFMQEIDMYLRDQSDYIDSLVDCNAMDYNSAKVVVIQKKYTSLSQADIRALLKKMEESSQKGTTMIVQGTTQNKITDVLKQDRYERLVDELTFAYLEFCEQNHISKDADIPENLKSKEIYSFPKRDNKMHPITA